MKDKKKLIILGKAPVQGKPGMNARLDWPGCEVWTVGTHKIKNADRYYEFHGLSVEGREMIRTVSRHVREGLAEKLPLNNSTSVMLMEAYDEGYLDIEIQGSPMIARDEYLKQRAALAMCIGYVRASGVKVVWPEEPEKVNYFEAYQEKRQ